MDTSDDELIDRGIAGDEGSLGQLWQRHRERLKRMVRVRLDPRLHRRVDPSDILQDAFLKVQKQLPNFPRGRMSVFVWLRRLTCQNLVDVHRFHLGAQRRSTHREASLYVGPMPEANSVSLAAQLLGHVSTASRAAIRAELRLRVEDALASMNTLDREVLALRHFEGLNNHEAAETLGISANAASNRYVRALRRLKEILADVVSPSDIQSL
jgi:RNA polymerase sigma-70 factor (ECF subfamily)